MADVKISALTAASALTGTELIETVQGGTNKKTTTQDIADLFALGYTAENVANKSTAVALGTSDTLYPSQKAVKAYVDARTPAVYAANMTQFSTIAPAEDTLFSSLPLGTLVWARSSAGIYTGTLAGQFLTGKVPYLSKVIYDATTATSIRGYYIVRTSDNVITLTTTIDGVASDGVLQGEFVQIFVYP